MTIVQSRTTVAGRLAGKVALISGAAGAGSGIGAATARCFAREGARLVLNDLDGERLDAIVAELRESGAEVVSLAGDASDSAIVDALVALAMEQFGVIDVLYANAAYSLRRLVGDFTDEEWRSQQRVVLDSVFYATRAVLPIMMRNGGGAIIAMASGAGIGGEYGVGAYAANKAAVINLMETVAMEYGQYNIRANSITPGPTGANLRPEIASRLTNLKRASLPEEVANLVLFLASDESSNISGVCIQGNIRAKCRPDA